MSPSPLTALITSTLVRAVSLNSIERGVDSIYMDRVVPLKQLKTIAEDDAVLVTDAVNKSNAGRTRPEQALQDIRRASTRVKVQWAVYLATRLTQREAQPRAPRHGSCEVQRRLWASPRQDQWHASRWFELLRILPDDGATAATQPPRSSNRMDLR